MEGYRHAPVDIISHCTCVVDCDSPRRAINIYIFIIQPRYRILALARSLAPHHAPKTMSTNQIQYSEKYYDSVYEYR